MTPLRNSAILLAAFALLALPAGVSAQRDDGGDGGLMPNAQQQQQEEENGEETSDWSLLSAFDYASSRLNSVVGIVETRFDRPRTDRKYDPWVVFEGNPRPLHGLKGSGFLYKKAEGNYYFVTTSQLMEDLNQEMEYPIRVEMADGSTYPGKLVGKNSFLKVAVVDVELPDSYSVPDNLIGNSSDLRIGQPVALMGTNIESQSIFVHGGIVSSIRKSFPDAEERVSSYIQVDAPFNFGMIGGPLITTQGRIVGLIRRPVQVVGGQMNINVVSPIDRVTDIADEIISGTRDEAYLGFEWVELSARSRRARQLPQNIQQGLLVTFVEEGSPADLAGLQVDDVITRIAGEEMIDPLAFRQVMQDLEVGESVNVTYFRPGPDTVNTTSMVTVQQPEEEDDESGSGSGTQGGHG